MTVIPVALSPVRIWLAAARPRTLPAAFAPVVTGTAVAIQAGSVGGPDGWPSLAVAQCSRMTHSGHVHVYV